MIFDIFASKPPFIYGGFPASHVWLLEGWGYIQYQTTLDPYGDHNQGPNIVLSWQLWDQVRFEFVALKSKINTKHGHFKFPKSSSPSPPPSQSPSFTFFRRGECSMVFDAETGAWISQQSTSAIPAWRATSVSLGAIDSGTSLEWLARCLVGLSRAHFTFQYLKEKSGF